VGNAPTRLAAARYYGLDKPLIAQYRNYLVGLGRGDFGVSIPRQVPVKSLIAERLPWSLLLMAVSGLLATVAGVAMGAHSGWKRGRGQDRGMLAFFIGLGNVPSYFVAMIALFTLAVGLGWFPFSGAVTQFASLSPWGRIADIAHHLALPAAVLALPFAGDQYLTMRSSLVSELGSDYLLGGRAKGLPERWLKYRYAARNALLPMVGQTALALGTAVTGSIFIETVFAYPGLGRLMFQSIGTRDYPTIQACFLLLSVGVLTANFIADLLMARLDPRVP